MTMMVGNDELWNLLQSEENDQLDFKSAELIVEPNEKNRYEIAKHMVGFANHQGGFIVFGVDDDRNPEGVDILEEKSLHTISEITSSKCRPRINYSHDYYSEKDDDLSEGAVFVLKVTRRDGQPSAIVEEKSGAIRKREYRLRSGESTRLVSDEELNYLFTNVPSTKFENETIVRYTHQNDFSPVDLQESPTYFFHIDPIYRKISEVDNDIVDSLADEDWDLGPAPKHGAIFRRVLLISIIELLYMNKDHTISRIVEKLEEDNLGMGYDFEIVSPEHLQHSADDDSVFSEFGFDLDEYLSEAQKRTRVPQQKNIGFLLPSDSCISLSKNFDEITISVEDEFSMSIGARIQQIKTGVPDGHPYISDYQLQRPNDEENKSTTTSMLITVEYDSNYPIQGFQRYLTSKYYYDEIAREISNQYSWEKFVEDKPDIEISKIMSRLDNIESMLRDT